MRKRFFVIANEKFAYSPRRRMMNPRKVNLNERRELQGFLEAVETLKIPHGGILTYDQEETLKADGHRVRLIPVWKWLLGLHVEGERLEIQS